MSREPVRAVAYSRVSTGRQVDGSSLGTQAQTCRDDIARRGWTPAGEYIERGVSGARESRPALDKLVADAEAGMFDAVVVAKLDRLGRSLFHLAKLTADFQRQGVRMVVVADGVDTGTETGRLLVGILGSIAEWERQRIRDRYYGGLRARVAEGGFVGSTAPYGYRIVKDAQRGRGVRLAIDEAQAACIRAMYELLVRDRVPIARAAEQLNAAGHRPARSERWTAEVLARWARGDTPGTAGGLWVWGDLTAEVPAILSPRETAEWQAWRSDTAVSQTGHGKYLLSGLVATPCGRSFHGRTAGKQAPTYSCRHRLTARGPDKCGCLNVSVAALDALVWGRVAELLTDPHAIKTIAAHAVSDAPSWVDDQMDAAMSAASDLRERVAVEYQAALDDGFDAETARAMVRGRQEALKAAQAEVSRLGKVRARAARSGSARTLQDVAEQVRQRVESGQDDKRAVLDALGVQVRVTRYEPCPACGGSGYQSLPPGSGRRFPPACAHCNRMRMLPVVDLDITAPEALLGLSAEAAG